MDWAEWIQRIYKILGLPEGFSLDAPSLPRPFLLAPRSRELSKSEASDLFCAVRGYLLGGLETPTTAGPIRHRIQSMSSEQSLPVLYSMRYVARNWGRPHRYWPEFCEKVLDNQIDLGTLRVGLASDFRNLWLRLYLQTDRALFYPREGRANIKWPIAHAGLLPRDLELLRSYGIALKEHWDPTLEELPYQLTCEIDDFLLDLLDWLDTSAYANDRLREMLDPDNSVSFSLADLARRWLIQHFNELDQEQIGDYVVKKKRPQVRIRYNANSAQLEAVLSETLWPGRMEKISIRFGETEASLQTIYDPKKDSTHTLSMTLPLSKPFWDQSAIISTDNDRIRVSVLSSPFETKRERGALLFRIGSGRRTRQWAVGEQYYLLAPDQILKQEWVSAIFSNCIPLGPPQGSWAGYDTLLVTARDPLEDADRSEFDARLEEINDLLAQAAAGLSLPGLTDIYLPRAQALGGELISDQGNLDSFALGSLPFFQVTGQWGSTVKAELKCWRNGKYVAIDSV